MIEIVFIDEDFQIGGNASLLGNKLPQSFSLSINLEFMQKSKLYEIIRWIMLFLS